MRNTALDHLALALPGLGFYLELPVVPGLCQTTCPGLRCSMAGSSSRLFLQSRRTGPVPNGCGLRDLCLMGVALVLLGLYCACSHISSKKSRQKMDSNGKVSNITLRSNLNGGIGQMIENSFYFLHNRPTVTQDI